MQLTFVTWADDHAQLIRGRTQHKTYLTCPAGLTVYMKESTLATRIEKNIGNINLVLMIYWFTYRHIKSESFISYIMITYFFVLTTSRVLRRISKHIKYESFISYPIITHFFVSTNSCVLGRILNIWCTWRMRFF
jgi:hypothetical protein